MKKVLIIMLCVIMAVTAGCGNNKDNGSGRDNDKSVSEEVQIEENCIDLPVVTILGDDYIFPMSYEDFKAKGWIQRDLDLAEEELENLEITCEEKIYFEKNDTCIEFCIMSEDGKSSPLKECQVVGFCIDKDTYLKTNVNDGDVILNHKLVIGEATAEEALVLWDSPWADQFVEKSAEPDSPKDRELYYYIKTETAGKYDWLSLSFVENGALYKIRLTTNDW